MFGVFSPGRTAIMVVLCVVLAACTQTSSTSYNGNLGVDAASLSKRQKEKILAARKRAAIKRASNRKKAVEARAEKTRKRIAYQTALLRKSKKTRRKTRKSKTRKLKTSRKKALRGKKTARKLRRRGSSKTRKSRKVRLKKKSSAFVGRRSGRIVRNAPWKCVPGRLKKVINQVSRKYGRVTVNSTHRSRRRNRRVGGKRRSYHLGCRAVDFRVHGRTRGLTRWLARHPSVGGFKRYRAGHYHIDIGPKRSW